MNGNNIFLFALKTLLFQIQLIKKTALKNKKEYH